MSRAVTSSPMVVVTVSAWLSQDGDTPNRDVVEDSIRQVVADAVAGSFDEYPRDLDAKVRLRARLVGEPRWRDGNGGGELELRIGLPAELFPPDQGGLQTLVTFLAGDVFPSEVSGCRWSRVTVRDVELPPGMRQAAINTFRRGRAYSLEQVRAAFALRPGQPLLAFSLKPRVGLEFSVIRRLTLDVLAAGFNIVELDSKHVALHSAPLSDWLRLGEEAAEAGRRHVTAFSPNFSMPTPQLVDTVGRWLAGPRGGGPAVVKIDGGLDGLSGLQTVRRVLGEGARQPIITSYPVLRRQLASAIGPSTWVTMLGLSGADVVYPGDRPTFPSERRPVWGSHVDAWAYAARRYDQLMAQGWPMPTIAGGVHPGHLHACYELVGPNVAYFLGGAVALHPEGPAAGARLCVSVLRRAAELADRATRAGDDPRRETARPAPHRGGAHALSERPARVRASGRHLR
ncbi:MAG TPA: RuBisCO large subunit C-terminal-like domain-containing protein [Pseudonocardiaceae bacterium]